MAIYRTKAKSNPIVRFTLCRDPELGKYEITEYLDGTKKYTYFEHPEKNRIENQRAFSKSLPSDWDSDDDDYVKMVEKAKARNKRIVKSGSMILPALGVGLGAYAGTIVDGPRGTIVGGLTGGATSYATQALLGKSLRSKGFIGTDKKSYEELGKRDQKAADRAIAKYRNMKTKEERLAWRKKIKSKV